MKAKVGEIGSRLKLRSMKQFLVGGLFPGNNFVGRKGDATEEYYV